MSEQKRPNAAAGLTAVLWATVLFTAGPVPAAEFQSGTNISGEVTADDYRAQRDRERQEQMYLQQQAVPAPPGMPVDPMRIDVPRGPDGMPQRPVRGLSRTEEMEMDDLENRYQMGLIGEAEYFSRRNAIMQRVGLEPEF
jgi:hypothetical protein